MAKQKEKIYNFVQVIKCVECGTVAKLAAPCSKCGKGVFVTELVLQEIK